MAKIKLGIQKKLYLGNLESKRDWGHAKDYVYAMWLILQKKKPKDYVIGTGKTYSVREFAKVAFEHVGLDYKKYIKIDKKLIRPAEVDLLIADFKNAKKELKWRPKIGFKELVKTMVDEDIVYLSSNQLNE